MIYIAIDPGWSGALAIQRDDGGVGAYPSPDTIAGIASMMRDMKGYIDRPITATIEKVHSMPGQGVKSVWRFAENTAAWKASLACMQIPFIEIPPKKWMKQLPCGLSKDKKTRKNQIKAFAQQVYPHLKVTLAKADALAMLWTMTENETPEEMETELGVLLK